MNTKVKAVIMFLAFLLAISSLSGISSVNNTAYAVEEAKVSFASEYARVGEILTVECSADGKLSYVWYVGGEKVACTKNSYIPTDKDIEKFIKAEVWNGSEKLGECSLFFSDLPVVYINTENAAPVVTKEEYINAEMKIQGNDAYNKKTTTLYDGAIEIKGRGNSTWRYFDKKPYKIKLDKKTNLFGYGKNKHWTLLANYIDETVTRNALATDVAKKLGSDGMDYVMVDLVFNGECVGNYMLCEHIRVGENRVDVYDWEGAAEDIADEIAEKNGFKKDKAAQLADYMNENMSWITTGFVTFDGMTYTVSDYYEIPDWNGGYLIELDDNYDEISKFLTKRNAPIMFKSPEYICTSNTAFASIANYIQNFEDAVFSRDKCTTLYGKKVSYTELCDFDSLVSYWLSSELFKNEMGYRSTYMYKDVDGPLVFGPVWDFDFSSGSVTPFGTVSYTGWGSTYKYWIPQLVKDPYFAVKVRELFCENKEYLYSLVEDGGVVDQLYKKYYNSGMNNAKIWSYSRGYEEDFAVFKQWLTDRISWISKEFQSNDSTLNSFGASKSGLFNLTLDGKGVYATEDGAYNVPKSVSSVLLGVNINSGAYSSFNYYVNGKYVGQSRLYSDTASIVISKELLTEKAGSKNVITVWLKDASGALCEMQYLTVTQREPSQEYVTILFDDNGKKQEKTYACGDAVYLPYSSSYGSEMLCSGWVDETGNLYAENRFITADKDMKMTASFEKCSNGSLRHTWVSSEDCEVCISCQKTRRETGNYVDVNTCTLVNIKKYNNVYTGKEICPNITVKYNNAVLQEGVNYTVTYSNNIVPGYATYTVKGIKSGGFMGVVSNSYKIIDASIDHASVTLEADTVYYDGKAKTPAVSVSVNGVTLKQGEDYTAEYQNNTEPGTATVVVTGIGHCYGSVSKTFKIMLSAPKGLTATANTGKISLKWDAAAGSDGYEIYRSVNGSAYKLYKTTKSASYTDSGIVKGSGYAYKIKTVVGGETSDFSTQKSAGIRLDAPAVTVSVAKNRKKVTLKWKKIANATGYTVYRKYSGGKYEKIASLGSKAVSYSDTSMMLGKNTYYKVVATGVSSSYGSADSNTVKANLTLVNASDLKLKAGSKSVTVSFKASATADYYVIYRATSKNGKYTAIKTTAKTSFTDKNLKGAKKYYYKVRSVTKLGSKKYYSSYSTAKSVVTKK